MSTLDGLPVLFSGQEEWRGTVIGDWEGHAGWVKVQWNEPTRFIGTHLIRDLTEIALNL